MSTPFVPRAETFPKPTRPWTPPPNPQAQQPFHAYPQPQPVNPVYYPYGPNGPNGPSTNANRWGPQIHTGQEARYAPINPFRRRGTWSAGPTSAESAQPQLPREVQPGSITYTTSVGPDGRVFYHPFKAVPAIYQNNTGELIHGIQWVPIQAADVLPESERPARRYYEPTDPSTFPAHTRPQPPHNDPTKTEDLSSSSRPAPPNFSPISAHIPLPTVPSMLETVGQGILVRRDSHGSFSEARGRTLMRQTRHRSSTSLRSQSSSKPRHESPSPDRSQRTSPSRIPSPAFHEDWIVDIIRTRRTPSSSASSHLPVSKSPSLSRSRPTSALGWHGESGPIVTVPQQEQNSVPFPVANGPVHPKKKTSQPPEKPLELPYTNTTRPFTPTGIYPPYPGYPAPTWGIPPPVTTPSVRKSWLTRLRDLAVDVLQEIYLAILLELPKMYFSRVSKIFTDAELYQSELEEMYRVSDKDMLDEEMLNKYQNAQAVNYNVLHLIRFKNTWEEFINGMITEWQVQNVVCVLLLSAVLTLLQIDDIGGDPLSRTTAVFSLVFALTALLHGCVFMARFGSMKKLHKAAVWAEEARSTTTSVVWNVWIFLALPAIWLAWSIIAFIVTVLSYVWRTGANEEHEPLPSHNVLGIRITISVLFALGFFYFGLALRTLSRYGSVLDSQWQARFDQPPYGLPTLYPDAPLGQTRPTSPFFAVPHPIIPPSGRRASQESIRVFAIPSPSPPPPEVTEGPYRAFIAATMPNYKSPDPPRTFPFPSQERITKDGLSFKLAEYADVEEFVLDRDVLQEYYVQSLGLNTFLGDLLDAWNGMLPIPTIPPGQLLSLRETVAKDVIQVWNEKYFERRHLRLTLVMDDISDPNARVIKIQPFYGPTNGPPRSARLNLSESLKSTESRSVSLSSSTRPAQAPTSRLSGTNTGITIRVQLPEPSDTPDGSNKLSLPTDLAGRGILSEEWGDFIAALETEIQTGREEAVIDTWNAMLFHPQHLTCSLTGMGGRSLYLSIKSTSTPVGD